MATAAVMLNARQAAMNVLESVFMEGDASVPQEVVDGNIPIAKPCGFAHVMRMFDHLRLP